MTMPFRFSDWKRLLLRLELARSHLARFKSAPKEARDDQRYLLDEAINALHAIAEYSINVNLELADQAPETTHQIARRAQELLALGHLKGDYHDVLAQLGNFRKFAQYGGYGRSGSTHYNATNVATCLSTVDQLVAETKTALTVAGKVES